MHALAYHVWPTLKAGVDLWSLSTSTGEACQRYQVCWMQSSAVLTPLENVDSLTLVHLSSFSSKQRAISMRYQAHKGKRCLNIFVRENFVLFAYMECPLVIHKRRPRKQAVVYRDCIELSQDLTQFCEKIVQGRFSYDNLRLRLGSAKSNQPAKYLSERV